MNKSRVFEYILQLEKGIKSILEDSPIKDMLVFEIINGSLIYAHELDASSQSDEHTARGIVRLVIKSLFTKEMLTKAFSKHVNCYNTFGIGSRSLIHNIDKENNYLNSIVQDQNELAHIVDSLIGFVDDFKFSTNMKSRSKKIFWFGIFAIIATLIFGGLFTLCGDNKPKNVVGHYVYVDAIKVVHVNRDCCFDTDDCNSKEERLMKKRGVVFLDTADFQDNDFSYCPKCVSDECFTELKRISSTKKSD